MGIEENDSDSRRAKIDAFLSQPVLARIATVDLKTLCPHAVPVWFGWDGESVWISSYSSTRKIRELRNHPCCSIVIDTSQGGQPLTGVVLEGKTELVTEPREFVREKATWIYTRYLGPEGVLAKDPQEWIHDPHNTIIKLTPERTYTW